MAIQTLQDTGNSYLVQSSYDGAVYRLASDDCVLKGIGDEFEIHDSGLDITFNAGSEAIICGNFFKVISNTTITLPASSTIYLCCRIDTSKANGSKGSFESLTQAQITNGNINGNDTKTDYLLYVITTDANGITNVDDKRAIKSLGGANITTDTLSAGGTTITLYDDNIKTNSILSFFTSIYGVIPSNAVVSNGNVVLTFEAQASNMIVGVKIEGEY